MNLKLIIETYRLRERIVSFEETKIELTNDLTNLYKHLQAGSFADIEVFFLKETKFKNHHIKMRRSWYNEHLNNSVEHFIAKLFCDTLTIVNYYSYLHDRYSKTKILSYPVEQFMLLDIQDLCYFSAKEYELTNPTKDITSAIEAIFMETKGTLLTPALKLLGFLCIISGSLKMNPVHFIHYYQIYNTVRHETQISNIKTPVNGKSPKNSFAEGITIRGEFDKSLQL